ncbi:MAG: tetratricopeptide repeat protein [Oscillatoria sp. PMC 1051.18]|nr:tetratricopeptide repeat protein [Oscillatoria sp. PMC 1050.18]MEC5031207.1 tetratricopeptide repeat protein [Oscillatoria sp. PMC 1051.18]
MKLSLCAIVKNEEKNLPKCLLSVKELIDEIVILDTGSSDRTVEVAKSFGAKLSHFQWCNDFAVARNEALNYVETEWVLVLDADEVLEPKIIPQIKQAIKNPDYLVINLLRQEIGAKQSPYSLISRLFRRHPAVRFSRPYHAIIDDSVNQLLQQENHWQIVSLPEVAILHYGYQQTAIASQDKYNRAQKIMEGYLANNPDDAYICNKLGALYLQINRLASGIELLQRGLKAAEIEPAVTYELHYHLGNAWIEQQDFNQAALHYQKAIAQPILPQLKLGAYNNLGSLLKTAGQLEMAKKAYQTALKIDPNFAVGYYNLGITLKTRGQINEAIACYQKAIQLEPNYAQAYQNLGVALLKIGQVAASLKAFEKAIALFSSQNPPEAERLQNSLEKMGLFSPKSSRLRQELFD